MEGTDLVRIAQAFSTFDGSKTKLETTAEYDARIARTLKRGVVGGIDINRHFLARQSVPWEYDADKGRITLQIGAMVSDSVDAGSFQGSNAFGTFFEPLYFLPHEQPRGCFGQ